jgi:ABC-2 type transport system permease protein
MDVKMNDYIDIVVFGKTANDKTDTELYSKKHKIISGLNKIEIIVDEEPLEAGIDPFFKLIDNYTEDNRKKIDDKTPLKEIIR